MAPRREPIEGASIMTQMNLRFDDLSTKVDGLDDRVTTLFDEGLVRRVSNIERNLSWFARTVVAAVIVVIVTAVATLLSHHGIHAVGSSVGGP